MKKFSSFLVLSLLMLSSFTAGMEYQRGDVNQDGNVSISDVTCLIDYLLTGTWPDADNYGYVDLGLPSGTLWATCNVGATTPEEFGDYFAWSETVPKDEYTYENYKRWYFDENGNRYISKYNTNNNFGPVDNKTELEPEDDAACVYMGTSWRIPSLEQVVELVNVCVWQWTQRNGVNGHLVTGPNGNTMFLPAAGALEGSSLEDAGVRGYYWSCALDPDANMFAFMLGVMTEGSGQYFGLRDHGYTVRAVRSSGN